MPGLPHVQLAPDLVLVAILPPLLYSSAFFTGLRDLRANLRPISLLAFGLVAATTCGVAVVAHLAIPQLSWAGAFTLGAILSPTDALAATEVLSRLSLPRRIVSILGAIRLDVFAASSCYYGLPSPEQGRAVEVKIPIQGHFALGDTWCTPQMVDTFEAGLAAAGKQFEIYRYDCDHGFFNPDIREYDAAAAALSWQRDLAFWTKHLK